MKEHIYMQICREAGFVPALEHGARHDKVVVMGRVVAIIPRTKSNTHPRDRQTLNSVSALRRHLEELHQWRQSH